MKLVFFVNTPEVVYQLLNCGLERLAREFADDAGTVQERAGLHFFAPLLALPASCPIALPALTKESN